MSEVLAVVTCGFESREHLLLGHRNSVKSDGSTVLPGGKALEEFAENPVDTVQREVLEETNLLIPMTRTLLVAQFTLDRYCSDGSDMIEDEFMIDVFRVRLDATNDERSINRIARTEELDPFWCPIDTIPYPQMPPDTQSWLPQVLDAQDGDLWMGMIEVSGTSHVSKIFQLSSRFGTRTLF